MKHTRLAQHFLCVLLVFLSLNGCKSVPSGAVDDVARALQRADDYADDALKLAQQAQQHADEARQATNLQKYLDEVAAANRAAQEAREAAENAQTYKNLIDDQAVVNKVNNASEETAALMNRLRLFAYQTEVDEISSRIIQENLVVEEELAGAVKEVVTAAFCSTLAEALVGPLPGNQEIKDTVRFRSILSNINLENVEDIIAEAIHREAQTLVTNLQQQEEKDNYKDACEELVGLF
jgi:hypothetical protein